jgi:hypothetical protein
VALTEDDGNDNFRTLFIASRIDTAALTDVRFIPSSGNIASVNWAVYGLL